MIDSRLHYRLVHAVTEYDRKQASRKGYNPYALAHYLGSIQENIIPALEAGTPLRQAIVSGFSGRLLDIVLKAVNEAPSTHDEQRM